MIFPMLASHERVVRRGETEDVAPRGAVPRVRAAIELECGHAFEVDFRYDPRGGLARARATAQAASLASSATVVCPRCPLP